MVINLKKIIIFLYVLGDWFTFRVMNDTIK